MQWRASVSKAPAPVAGGSSRICYQIDGVAAERLVVTLFKFVAGAARCTARFRSVNWQSRFITNEWMRSRGGGVPQRRQITGGARARPQAAA